ncbi:MAG: Cys-Gln thioester bond-forming surface protein [Oscillospiraceae bacterium]|nr:Cys-Gln thioester bond-forming surface protein [Oscillospiraceae bacterium]
MANIRRIFALCMVLCLFVTVIPLQALAADETVTTTETTVNGDLTTTVETTTTTSKSEDGTTKVVVEIQNSTTTDKNGEVVAGSEVTRTETSSFVKKDDGFLITENWTENGSEFSEETTSPENVTVTVPDQKGQENTVTVGDKAGTETTNPDGTTSTVIQQGSVTVGTTDVIYTENIDTENTSMDHVSSDTTPTDDNDLTYVGQADEMYLPGYEGTVTAPEGSKDDSYGYTFVGTGNTSKFVPSVVYTEPLDEAGKLEMYGENAYIKNNNITWYYVKWLTEETKATIATDENGKYVTDEEGYILDVNGDRIFKEERTSVDPDGNTVYLHRFDNYNNSLDVEGWYEDGEWIHELNGDKSFTGVWAGPQQFILVDDNGNVVTTYCADVSTPTQDSYGYNVENLEDATYYSEEEAKQIRSIANNGYWGTASGFGSLEALKETLAEAGFTAEELASLTDGAALTATQMAIWSCSNKMSSIQFINSHYSNWGPGNVPADKEDEVQVMFKYYTYLMNLEGTELEGTTADTIINPDNFIRDMSVTVVEKAEEHENNEDADDTNDAYVTNLTFALVVTPSTENGDDLVVSVVDAKGNVLATGRIAGVAAEGENVLVPDAEGNYCFEGLTMIEGEQNFRLNLSGIQNLKEGVYLYSSEIRTEDSGEEVSSQTLVGVSSGERAVDVTMEIKFELNVDDTVIATERVWQDEGDPITYFFPPQEEEELPPPPPVFEVNIEDDEVVIEDEPVPLADAPKTGSNTVIWFVIVLAAAMSLAVVRVFTKKHSNKAF